MVSGFYAERLIAAIEVVARRGKQEEFDGIESAIETLENEARRFTDDLRSVIAYEPSEAENVLSKKKADVLDIVEELRISVDTTYSLKNAIQNKMNDLEARLNKRDEEVAALLEEFRLLRKTMQNNDPSGAELPASMLNIVTEINDKISTMEKQFSGEKEGLALTRKDMLGIIGTIKDFRKMFLGLITRFSDHMTHFHQKKTPTADSGEYLLKKYDYKSL